MFPKSIEHEIRKATRHIDIEFFIAIATMKCMFLNEICG